MKPFSTRTGVALLTAITLAIALGSLPSQISFAQVGPPAPRTQPAPEGGQVENLKNSFMKFFGKKEEGKEGEPANTSVDDVKTGKVQHQQPAQNLESEGEPAPQQPPARPPMLSQPPLKNPKVETPQVSKENPPVKTPTLDNPENPLGLTMAQNRLNETAKLLDKKDYTLAKNLLTPLRQWLIDSTEAHINLYKTLNNIPSARAQAELEKQVALEFAILRDKAFLQMGKIYVMEQSFPKAVKELTEVVKSQPRSDMGIKAYELLQEIGFTQKLQLAE